MECKTCGIGEQVEIAAKTIRGTATGVARCHRLECGHAWHRTVRPADAPEQPQGADEPTRCTCGEIAIVNGLLIQGRQHASLGPDLSEEAFRQWLQQVLEALDGIPAESGARSLLHSATLAAKPHKNAIGEQVISLNKLLGRAIKAVS